MPNKRILDFLESLGLTQYEAKVYEGLVKLKKGTVKEIAESVEVNRITAHDSIKVLIQKGLASQVKIGSRRREIVLEPPERIEYLIEQKESQLRELKNSYTPILEQIKKIKDPPSQEERFEVRFYEGHTAVMQVYKEILKANNVYSFADLERYYQVFPETSHLWIEAFKKNPKRQMWDLLVDSTNSRKVAKEKFDRYYIKILPDSNLFKGIEFADYLIFDDKMAIVKLDIENPVATVIESADVTASLRALHQTMWSIIP